MNEARFKIGDMVETNWNGTGKITDIMYSAFKNQYTYEVTNEEDRVSELFSEDSLKPAPVNKEYSMQINIDIAENVVIASLYEVVGPNMRPIAKGHGHIIHEGEIGIAQAASYATNRLRKKIGGFAK